MPRPHPHPLLLATLLAAFPPFSLAQTVSTRPLKSDGLISDTDLTQLFGVTYHSISYEPVCGTLGAVTNGNYDENWDVGNRCPTAMDAFLKLPDPVVIYDRTGVRVGSSSIGKHPTCLCFTLNTIDGDMRGNFCIYLNEKGQLEEMSKSDFSGPPKAHGTYAATTFRRDTSSGSVGKALPDCASSNLEELAAAWSATAIGVGTPVSRSALPPNTQTTPKQSLGTSTSKSSTKPSSTGSAGSGKSQDDDSDTGPLPRSDRIAIGLGLGIGIPTLVISLWGAIRKIRQEKKEKQGKVQELRGSGESAVELHPKVLSSDSTSHASSWAYQEPYPPPHPDYYVNPDNQPRY